MEIRRTALNLFILRFEGEDTIMAPEVIRASYILFSELGDKMESSDDTTLRRLMMEALSQNKFSHEFSMKIVDFILEHRS
jgi:hypothetical protein